MLGYFRRSAVLVGLLGAFLSVSLVAPSAARADALPEPKPMPSTVRNLFSVPNQVGGSTLPAAPAPVGTGGQVIKGPWRVFPGTTKVIPPSLLRIVRGSASLGIGLGSGEMAAPLDYIRAGVPWGCAFADFACSDGDRQKKFDTDQTVKDTPGVLGVPLFNDLWAWLTGQFSGRPGDAVPQFADFRDGELCTKTLAYSGGNTGSFSMSVQKFSTLSDTPGNNNYYNGYCGDTTLGTLAYVRGVCKHPDGTTGGLMNQSDFGWAESVNRFWGTATGAQTADPCGAAAAAGTKLIKLQWYSNRNDGYADVRYKYGEWIDPDPDVDTVEGTEITSTVTCKDSGGGLSTVTSRTGAAAFAGLPQCPAGSVAIGYETKGGLPGQEVKIAEGGLAAGAEAAAPDCLGAGSSGCAMNVFIDGQQCTVRVAGCADWAATYGQSPTRFDCKYGSYTVQGSDCLAVLKDAYKSEGGTAFNPQYPNTAPSAINHTTNHYIYPSPEPWNPTSPANFIPAPPAPAPAPAPGAIPITGTNPQFDWQNCIGGGGWSWNPVDWVATPVSCAMQAMFKPDPVKGQARADAMKAKLSSVGVEPLITAVNTNVTAIAGVAGGSGCSGPAVRFDAVGISKTIYPFSACEQPIATLAMFSNALATLVLVVGGGFGMIRAVAMGFGFNFTMGRTGGTDS